METKQLFLLYQIPTNLHLPRGQIETSLEAAKDVNLGLWPDVLDASLDPLHHTGAHVVLLGAGHHPLEEVLDLLVQPAHCSQLERPDGTSAIFPWQWMYIVRADDRRQNPILIYECSRQPVTAVTSAKGHPVWPLITLGPEKLFS